jgi:hypothetical protein
VQKFLEPVGGSSLSFQGPLTIPPKGSGDQRVLRPGLLGLDALHHCEVRGLKHPCFHPEGAGESTLFPEKPEFIPSPTTRC